MSCSTQLRPLILGEVLFDCFSDRRVLGGAPFNVAWNLKGLGVNPLVVTAVGQDDLGSEVVHEMKAWEMDLSGLQILPRYPTGRVDIQVSAGQPTYTFLNDTAFDHIQGINTHPASDEFGLLYHGSLALRDLESRSAIQQLRQQMPCPVFIDINVRLPYFNIELFEPFMFGVEHLKLNDDELRYLAEISGKVTTEGSSEFWDVHRKIATDLMDRFQIKNLWLTAGSRGAAWLGDSGQYLQVNAPRVNDLVDTVGAGDALAAVIVWSLLTERSPEIALPLAAAYAARVCTLRGAITRDKAFYNMESLA